MVWYLIKGNWLIPNALTKELLDYLRCLALNKCDGRADRVKPIYSLFQLCWAGDSLVRREYSVDPLHSELQKKYQELNQ